MQLYEQDQNMKIQYSDFLANFVNLKEELSEEDIYLGNMAFKPFI